MTTHIPDSVVDIEPPSPTGVGHAFAGMRTEFVPVYGCLDAPEYIPSGGIAVCQMVGSTSVEREQ